MERAATLAGTHDLGDGLVVQRVGFGAMRVTGRGVWGPPRDRPAALRLLRRAVELGIDLLDTADSYGPSVSEELIAEAVLAFRDGLAVAAARDREANPRAAFDVFWLALLSLAD